MLQSFAQMQFNYVGYSSCYSVQHKFISYIYTIV
jgi:hypothetical protein